MTFLKGLVDGLNHAEYDLVGYVPSLFDEWVHSVTFYHNLAFIEKGDNREPSTLLPVHPRTSLLMQERPRSRPPGRPVDRIVRPIRRVARGARGRLRRFGRGRSTGSS
jgi:hypothetical protein